MKLTTLNFRTYKLVTLLIMHNYDHNYENPCQLEYEIGKIIMEYKWTKIFNLNIKFATL